jgi:hypothetical protein
MCSFGMACHQSMGSARPEAGIRINSSTPKLPALFDGNAWNFSGKCYD